MARVLVVEDKAENLDLLTYLLTAFGHEVLTARDGVDGVATMQAELPDLVIMDLQMPRMDGFEAAKIIKADEAVARIPLVAVTAYAMVGDRDSVMAAGFDGYVTKPIDPEAFVRELERFLPKEVP